MHHKTTDTPKTAGRVIHRGVRWYDLFGTVISFGRDKAIRGKLIELAAPAPGEKVLDVGCGTGTLAMAIKPWVGAGEVHGIDASPEMIQVAKVKAARDGSSIDFRVALIEALPFPDASFDCAVAAWMLFHVPDLDRGLSELARVLRPGGRLVAVTNASEHLAELRAISGTAAWALVFSRENGADLLARHFGHVERRDADGWVTIESEDAVRAYVASIGPRAPRDLPDFEVPLRTRRASSIFVADK